MNAVLIEWIDSETKAGSAWHTTEDVVEELDSADFPSRLSCFTLGFVVWENSHAVAVTSSYHEEEIGPYTIIPTAAIIKRTDLPSATDP